MSIQVGSIEAAVGTPLLLRTGRGVRLTEAGELLLNYAERVLALWNEMGDSMDTFLGSFSGTLRVGAVATTEYWMPSLLVAFVKENPKVKVKLVTGNREGIVRSLASARDRRGRDGQPARRVEGPRRRALRGTRWASWPRPSPADGRAAA